MSTLAEKIVYPVWAHAEYEDEKDELLTLAESLEVGDVVQINDYKPPLQVESRARGVIHFATAQEERHTSYSLEREYGAEHALYFNHGVGRSGVECMGVIYRADGSISPLSLDYLLDTVNVHGMNARYEVTWEDVERTVSPADPRAPLTDQWEAMDRVAVDGEAPKDVEEAQIEYEFVEKTRVVDELVPPIDYNYPAGTLYFRFAEENDSDGSERVVPIDQVASVKHLGQSGKPGRERESESS